MASSARGWRRCGLYVWRTRKPHSFLGLPLIGRHTAYVGETGSRYHRDRQHRYGGGRYAAARKDWSDLDPKVYPLPCAFPASEVARKIQEKIWIRLLLPVYNTEWNGKNPRRIKPGKAEQQRWARDKSGLRVNVGRALSRWAVIIGFWSVVGWGAWQQWIR